jgi:hypothetical protein
MFGLLEISVKMQMDRANLAQILKEQFPHSVRPSTAGGRTPDHVICWKQQLYGTEAGEHAREPLGLAKIPETRHNRPFKGSL